MNLYKKINQIFKPSDYSILIKIGLDLHFSELTYQGSAIGNCLEFIHEYHPVQSLYMVERNMVERGHSENRSTLEN